LDKDVAERIPSESSFTVFGFDILHIGSSTFRTGALIGVPVNYAYKSSISPADKKNIVVSYVPHSLLLVITMKNAYLFDFLLI
jgi:hypothetical protein